jgi:hypothetical protein
MDTIPYRNGKIMVKTIPKGTLLFRLVSRINNDETRGVKIGEDERCIIPNHNVFFYPNPFAASVGLNTWSASSKNMLVFLLEKDVKVMWLLKPSKHSRLSKNTKRNFIKRCSTVKRGCMPDKKQGMLAAYNPCVSDTIIKKFPDVVGIITVAIGDARRFTEGIPKLAKKKSKFFHLAEAEQPAAPSIPELILHPLALRPQKELHVQSGDKLDNNYSLLKKFNLNDEAKIIKFMENHAVYNSDTFFYEFKN